MIQELIIPSLATLLTGSALFSAFYVRKSAGLNKQVQALTAEDAPASSEKLAEVGEQLEKFRSRMEELERRRQETPIKSSVPVPSNRSGQVLRLYQSGESVSSIASALGVSQGEVKLTVKVQELLAAKAAGEHIPNFL